MSPSKRWKSWFECIGPCINVCQIVLICPEDFVMGLFCNQPSDTPVTFSCCGLHISRETKYTLKFFPLTNNFPHARSSGARWKSNTQKDRNFFDSMTRFVCLS